MGSCFRRYVQRVARLAAVCLIALLAGNASAPETDNFFLPLDSDLADLGEYLEAVHNLALENAVSAVNTRIESALKIEDAQEREELLNRYHDPDTLVAALLNQFSHPYFEGTMVEDALVSASARRCFPGQHTICKGIWMNFSAHLPLEPRQMMMLVQSGTVKAYGVYFGTDKLIHFHSVGWSYYQAYRSHLKAGCSPEEAILKVIRRYSRHDLLAENTLFGTITTGIYSNADLAANLAGFTFLCNLTERVALNGKTLEPLVVRCGKFWCLNRQVRPRSGWFACYISDHWNEALNPNLYDFTMRPGISRVLRSRAAHIVQFYTGKDGRPSDPAYFDNLARELSTYYGEPYGHSGDFELLMTIGNTCFPVLQNATAGLESSAAQNK